jgi:hypothetical protein
VGYWYTASENYDICWTMPHCVLSLRLIGKLNTFFDSVMPHCSIIYVVFSVPGTVPYMADHIVGRSAVISVCL